MTEQDKKRMVTAVFRDRTQANRVYTWLRDRGYTADEINVLMSDQTRAKYAINGDDALVSSRTHAAEGIAAGGVIGTAVGATVAAIAAIGTMAIIPGLGMVVAGPILGAFAGAGAGTVAGGIIGGLIGLGIPESNARAYEQALRDGGVVIGVQPHAGEEIQENRGRVREAPGRKRRCDLRRQRQMRGEGVRGLRPSPHPLTPSPPHRLTPSSLLPSSFVCRLPLTLRRCWAMGCAPVCKR